MTDFDGTDLALVALHLMARVPDVDHDTPELTAFSEVIPLLSADPETAVAAAERLYTALFDLCDLCAAEQDYPTPLAVFDFALEAHRLRTAAANRNETFDEDLLVLAQLGYGANAGEQRLARTALRANMVDGPWRTHAVAWLLDLTFIAAALTRGEFERASHRTAAGLLRVLDAVAPEGAATCEAFVVERFTAGALGATPLRVWPPAGYASLPALVVPCIERRGG